MLPFVIDEWTPCNCLAIASTSGRAKLWTLRNDPWGAIAEGHNAVGGRVAQFWHHPLTMSEMVP